MATAADVPNKYDVVINGNGYMLTEAEDVKAQYAYTRTFVERQNTQGQFGDQFQDFWLTSSQDDWSLGEDQQFFRANDDDSKRRYWLGSGIDVSVPGRASQRFAVRTLTLAAAAKNGCSSTNNNAVFATSTNLYNLASDGTITDKGAHGLGADFFGRNGMCFDGAAVYLSTEIAGTVGVRRYNPGAGTFSTFSANAASSLAFLNNSLYGWRSGDSLVRWDTAGTRSTLFTWVSSDGGTTSINPGVIKPWGSKLAILRGGEPCANLWQYDGVGVTLLYQFTPDFVCFDMEVLNGIIFVSGAIRTSVSGTIAYQPAIFYFANGTPGLLWKSQSPNVGLPAIGTWNGGLVCAPTEPTRQAGYYDQAAGGLHRIADVSSIGSEVKIFSSTNFFVVLGGSTTGYQYPNTASATTSSTVTSSLFDFDSSLDKLFRGIKVDFDSATDGNGGTVDISYRVGDLAGSYTSLQTGATSGTEYTLSGISGRSISVKVTLNKGTSTSGPVLKRVSVRAAPKQLAFQRGTLVIQATGRDGTEPLVLRDGVSFEPRDGLTIATDLRTVAATATPVSMTTEFGTIANVVFENDGFELRRIRPNEFIVVAPWREV